MVSRLSRIASVFALGIVSATCAEAQIRASERGSVSQTVDGTVITVDYSRLQVRGRKNLFGGVVHKGEVWTPGANWATTFEVSRDVRLNGHAVPEGKYSVWMVTGPDEWTVHLHRNPKLFHTKPPKLKDMFLSFPVTPGTGEHVEVQAFDFQRVGRDGTTLRMRWGTTVVSMEILVKPSRSTVAMRESEITPYLGSYLLTFHGENGPSPEMKLQLVNAKGVLRGIVDGQGEPMVMEFIPTGEPHRFMPAFVSDEKVVDVETVSPVTFEMSAGRAVGFTAPGIGSELWMVAKRKN